MLIKKRIPIYALYIYGQAPKAPTQRRGRASRDILYFRTKADAVNYQNSNFKNTDSEVRELDAIEDNGKIKHFHYKPSAERHGFGSYILDTNLCMELLKYDEWVLVGLNRPHPNKRIAGSPSTYKEVKHWIWAGKVKNELVTQDAKLLNKSVVFADQRALKCII